MRTILAGAGLLARPGRRTMLLLVLLLGCGTAAAQVIDTVIPFLGGAYELQFVQNGKLYVREDRLYYVIDCSADTLLRTIQVSRGSGYSEASAYNWRHNRIYEQCSAGETAMVAIDCAADTVLYTLPVHYSGGYAYNSRMDRIYATTDEMFVVDCTADTVMARIPPKCGVSSAIWDSIGNKVYSCGGPFNDPYAIYAIDCSTNTRLRRMVTPVAEPSLLALNYDRRVLYAGQQVNYLGGVIIDCVRDTMIARIDPGSYSITPAIVHYAAGKVYWQSNYDDERTSITVMDIASDSVIRRIHAPTATWGPNISDFTLAEWNNRIYSLWDWTSAEYPNGRYYIGVIDCATDSVLRWTGIDAPRVSFIRANPDNHRLYATMDGMLYVFRDELADVYDLTMTRLLSPLNSVDSGGTVIPACSVYSRCTQPVSYPVRMRIGSQYDTVVTVTGHQPGTSRHVEFPAWTALERGRLAVACSTELAGDEAWLDDVRRGQVVVDVRDVALAAVIAPADTVDSGAAVIPRVVVENRGTMSDYALVRLNIGGDYEDSAGVALQPGRADTAVLAGWSPVQTGEFAWRCTVATLRPDMLPANNLLAGVTWVVPAGIAEPVTAVAAAGRFELAPNPAAPGRPVRCAVPAGPGRLVVADALGRIVFAARTDGRPVELALPASGVYVCRYVGPDVTASRKLVLRR